MVARGQDWMRYLNGCGQIPSDKKGLSSGVAVDGMAAEDMAVDVGWEVERVR